LTTCLKRLGSQLPLAVFLQTVQFIFHRAHIAQPAHARYCPAPTVPVISIYSIVLFNRIVVDGVYGIDG
jgi:hypothetical protein